MELLVDFAGKVFGVEDIFVDMLIPRMDPFQVTVYIIDNI